MPKRTTLNFSSESAPPTADGERLYVYYCKHSSRHVLTSDVDLQRAPRRRTDSARVIDTSRHSVRLYTTAADKAVVLQRPDGTFEKQYRQYSSGKLPVAYRSEPDGAFLYVLEGAVTTFSQEDREAAVPVPPCIRSSGPATVEIILEISDRGQQLKLVKISADIVQVQTTRSNAAEDANEELIEFMRGVLGTKHSDVTMLRGSSARHRRLLVSGLTPLQVYQKLQGAL